MQSKESRRVVDDGGRTEPMKRQARTDREVGPEVDGEPEGQPGSGDRRGIPGDESVEDPVETRSQNLSHSSPLSWHIPVDVQVWWGWMS